MVWWMEHDVLEGLSRSFLFERLRYILDSLHKEMSSSVEEEMKEMVREVEHMKARESSTIATQECKSTHSSERLVGVEGEDGGYRKSVAASVDLIALDTKSSALKVLKR
tara:strand:- start:883 stop:1209 length:327 start_codon:yes stop_codon:yes gene_type:complete